jgi:UDPglucose 6-dehydrogenase
MTSRPSILVVGAGYVGLATAVFLADTGYPVNVIEKNPYTVESLSRGRLHFREPLLQKKLRQVLKRKKLQLSRPAKTLYQNSQFIFIAIDSANPVTGKMRMANFEKMARWIGDAKTKSPPTVVLKSTNVIGFAEKFQGLLNKTAQGNRVRLVVNPEFLREGFAYEDTAHPWRIIIGVNEKKTAAPLLRLYKSVYNRSVPTVITNWKSAELIKLASNVYLSHRLAFIHEIADFARNENLDIDAVRQGIGLDPRIGLTYFEPGLGFGGSCLPKDCHLINSREAATNFQFKTARTALEINERILDGLIDGLRSKLGRLKGKKIAILGAAFKPEVDDTRGSQAVKLALKLKRRGAKVAFFEPYLKQTEKLAEGNFPLEDSLETVLQGASAVIIGTAHKQFRSVEPKHIAKLVKRRLVSDYFGILNRTRWEKKGFEFI